MEVEESTKDDIVENVREELRNLIHTERKESRTKTLNKNRVSLGNIVTNLSFTTEFVAEKARALKKKPLSIEDYKQLQNALIQSEENVNAFLKVDNILFALVRDFSGNDPALQLCAISCSCNIALGNAKACTSLTKSIGPYLITKLDTLNYPLLDVCIWTIGNLIAGSDKTFEILNAQGCLKYLISLMRNCDYVIVPSVTYAAMHYVHVGFQSIGESEMMDLARATAKRKLSFETPYFIWLLALLSSHASCIPYLHDLLPSIADYLYQKAVQNFTRISEITACIRVLANAAQDISGELTMFLLENPKYTQLNLETLLNALLSSQYIHIRKETLWLIGNLYNHNCISVKNISQPVISRLSSLEQAIMSVSQPTMFLNAELIN